MALPVTITGISTAVAAVGPFKVAAGSYSLPGVIDTAATLNTNNGIQGAGSAFGTAQAQTFTNGASALTIPSIVVNMFKTGSPSDNLYAEITATDPNGTVLATSATVAASTITVTTASTSQQVTFTFASPATISASATFAVRLWRDGANVPSNYCSVAGSIATTYAGGQNYYYNGSTWTAQASVDLKIVINGTTTIASDAYYFFGRDGTTATTLQAYKSTAPDTSWSSISTKTGFTTAILNLAGSQDGKNIHIVVQDGTMSSSVATKYLSFDAATDTFLATTETVLAASAITGQSTSGWNVSLVVRSTGEAVIFYNSTQTNTSGTARARLGYKRRTALNTFSAAVQVDPNTATESTQPIAVLGASDRVHLLFFNGTNTMQRHLTSANVLGTAASTGATTAVQDACRYDDSGTIRHVGFTAAQSIRWASADNPTVTAATIAFGTPVRVIDESADVYALYQNSGDSDLYVKKSTDDGATFDGGTNAFTGTVTAAAASVSKNQTVYQRGNFVFPYLVNDNGTLKYNEYTVRSTGPTGYTLTADKGTFALTGIAAATRIARQLPALAYAVALTGQATGLRRGYPLAAVTGTFALSGQAAILSYARKPAVSTWPIVLGGPANKLAYGRVVPFAKGTLALTGQATALRADRFVRATATPYVLTGKDATLTWTSTVVHRTMPAATGAIALGSSATALKRNYVVQHTAGAVVLGGQVTALRATRTLPAVKGTLSLTGQATGLRLGRVLPVTAGVFQLTGVAAGLKPGRVLTASSGTLVLSGQAVVLGYGSAKTMLASTGTIVLGGQANKLAYGRKFVVTAGAFVLTGQAATLRWANVTIAVKGTFALTGFTTGLRLGRMLAARTATTFALNGQAVTLRYTRKMGAVVGAVVLNGTATNLVWSAAGARTMPAVTGSFVLTGKAVTFKQTAVIKATVTSFALTGLATGTRTDRRLTATTGSFVLTGNPAALTGSGKKLAAETGAVVLTGSDADLVYHVIAHNVMSAAPAYLRLVWSNAAFDYAPIRTGSGRLSDMRNKDDYGFRNRRPPPPKLGRR